MGRKYNIKLIHLQTTRNDEREVLSHESLKKVSNYGIEYVLIKNEPYLDLPPSENCMRPECVSISIFNEEQTLKYGTTLTPAHYGCYKSFKDGILSEFNENLDFLIVCEGDCLIEIPINEFVDKVYQCADIINKNNIGYFSFGDTHTLDNNWLQSEVVEEIPDQNLLFITDKIIGIQCIMFPKSHRDFLFDRLKNHKWDAADIYFNIIFGGANKMGILKKRITSQFDGYSLIDGQFKKFRKKKIIFIAPHLSTGGLPQYLFKKIETLKNFLEIFCVEYENITGGVLVVQRNRITKILDGDHFFSLGENKKEKIIKIINDTSPDYIHLEEIPEYFLPTDISDFIYNKDRKYKIFETSHDSSFDPDNRKIYFPDAFFFVSNWQIEQYKNIDVPKYLAEYPIEYKERPNRDETLKSLGLDPNKKHILNVGLFTPRKNQLEVFEMAKKFDDSVEFHFLGNQADNFKFYWEPIISNKPSNCRVWGERSDTDVFYSCMDVFFFTSKGNAGDKETMPLVLRESLGWGIPILMYNLEVYLGYFDKFNNVKYLTNSMANNYEILSSLLKIEQKISFESWYVVGDHIFHIKCLENSNLENKKLNVILSDSINNLVVYGFEITFSPNITYWFTTNSNPIHLNGFKISVYHEDKNIYSKVVYESKKSEIICPKVNNECIKIHHNHTDQSSWFSFYEIFLKEEYKNIKKNNIVVDIGANLGLLSLYSLNKGVSKVFSIEPDPQTFKYLKENTKKFKEIIPLQYAISDTDGEVDFFESISSSVNTIYKNSDNINYNHNGDKKIKVKSINPNTLLKKHNIDRIDYLKIDCEGAEYEFFKTIDEDYLSNNIKYITGEIHKFAGTQSDYENFIKSKLIRCNFDVNENGNFDDDPSISIFIFTAKKRPKIKIVHLLNNPENNREYNSIRSIEPLVKYGMQYQQIVTPLYKDIPPKENCNRPYAISDEPGEYLLSSGHYGCYLAHKKGILETLNDDVDAILLNECDSILQVSPEEMSKKIYEAYELSLKYDLAYISFGKQIIGQHHNNPENDFFITDNLSEAHCILIPKSKYEYFKQKFDSSPWDVSDLWYNIFITDFKKGIFNKPYSLQNPGISYIDLKFKDGFILH